MRNARKIGDGPPRLGSDVGIIAYPRSPLIISGCTNANREDVAQRELTIGRIAERLVNRGQ